MNCRPRCKDRASDSVNDSAGLSCGSRIIQCLRPWSDLASSTGSPTRFSVNRSRRMVFSLTECSWAISRTVAPLWRAHRVVNSIHCRSSVGVSGIELLSWKRVELLRHKQPECRHRVEQ